MSQVSRFPRRQPALLRTGLLLLMVVIIMMSTSVVNGEPGKVVTLFEYYPARQAAFGADVPEWGWINLMLPPRNLSTLCQYPEIALEVNDTKTDLPQNRVNVNLGMLVRTGNCSAEQQARNAVRLKYEGGVSYFRYLIIQGESNDGNMLGVLFPETNLTNELSSLVVLSTTYRAGEYLRDDIHSYQESERPVKSPYLYDETSVDWDMVGNIDPYRFTTDSPRTDNFYWFRILLFTLLIVSPCIRAAYLWWAGGGRFRLRRNEQGRVTGIQYVRPAPYWLSNGLIPGGRPTEPTTDVLTEEEFQALPEIEYKRRDDTEAQEDDIDVEAAGGASSDPPKTTAGEQVQPVAASINHIDPAESIPPSIPSTSATTATPAAGDSTVDVDLGGEFESTCTLCSICIDDFDEGEKLVLLPRCRHSFHRECIHPWLTERQGCCPLCKTSVLEKDETRTAQNGDSSSDSDSSDSTSSSVNTRRIRNRDDPSATVATSTVGELDESEGSAAEHPAAASGTAARRQNGVSQSGPSPVL